MEYYNLHQSPLGSMVMPLFIDDPLNGHGQAGCTYLPQVEGCTR